MPRSSIEFPYAICRERGDGVCLPTIRAQILTRGGMCSAELLLDSGADCSMLPKYYGILMGLSLRKLPKLKVEGITGKPIRVYRAAMTLQISRFRLAPIPCFIADSDTAPLLLGREGFFDLFNITFDNRRKKLVLAKLF